MIIEEPFITSRMEFMAPPQWSECRGLWIESQSPYTELGVPVSSIALPSTQDSGAPPDGSHFHLPWDLPSPSAGWRPWYRAIHGSAGP